ncbi:unnamed protein product [Wuchereria bancrofti]|uniref:Uncharacterized protein n=1 Tax=Wuchereria bancrofti TaxID=6293 RepID=A0A3P7FRI3_WUCBA|nr:unnamed protein product [Wuchereria bancrofti]
MYGIGRINATDVMKTTADDRVKLNELNSARFPTILAAVAVAFIQILKMKKSLLAEVSKIYK